MRKSDGKKITNLRCCVVFQNFWRLLYRVYSLKWAREVSSRTGKWVTASLRMSFSLFGDRNTGMRSTQNKKKPQKQAPGQVRKLWKGEGQRMEPNEIAYHGQMRLKFNHWNTIGALWLELKRLKMPIVVAAQEPQITGRHDRAGNRF